MSFGTYPEVSLKEARNQRETARTLVAQGVNPQLHRKQARLIQRLAEEQRFQGIFDHWIEHRRLTLSSGRQGTLEQIQRIFRKGVLPMLGKRSVYEITQADLLQLLARIEARKAFTTAQKCRLWLKQLFRFAMVKLPGLDKNPAQDLAVAALPKPPVTHNPFLRVENLPLLLQALRDYRGSQQVQQGLRLLLLTGVRTGELRWATREQFDLKRGLWSIPAEHVKQLQVRMRKEGIRPADMPPYQVPLSRQALEVARQLLGTMRPAQRHLLAHRSDLRKPISESTLNQALKSLGFDGQLTCHGICGTLTTALNELGYPCEWLDGQLSHVTAEGGGPAYNHAEHVESRRHMMQDWADRLDLLEQGAAEGAQAPSLCGGAENVSRFDELGVTSSVVHLEGGATVTITISSGNAPGKEMRRVPVPSLMTELNRLPDSKQLSAYEVPNNLPLSVFARMAGKTEEQMIRDIQAGRLLAFHLSDRGYRIPDWQLEPAKYLLTLVVPTQGEGADAWAIYRALSMPTARLAGRSPLTVVTAGTILEMAGVVCGMLVGREGDE